MAGKAVEKVANISSGEVCLAYARFTARGLDLGKGVKEFLNPWRISLPSALADGIENKCVMALA